MKRERTTNHERKRKKVIMDRKYMYCRFFDLDIADIPTGQQQKSRQA